MVNPSHSPAIEGLMRSQYCGANCSHQLRAVERGSMLLRSFSVPIMLGTAVLGVHGQVSTNLSLQVHVDNSAGRPYEGARLTLHQLGTPMEPLRTEKYCTIVGVVLKGGHSSNKARVCWRPEKAPHISYCSPTDRVGLYSLEVPAGSYQVLIDVGDGLTPYGREEVRATVDYVRHLLLP